MNKAIYILLSMLLLTVSVTSVSAFSPPDPSYLEPYQEIIEPAFCEA